ncbi:phospholipase D family protein [Sorangium sp. So ce1504]|uniref:phospholipase D family protein n=1 Tax=Sorangium sp. So ce1504 TaxID=3133337 RepID=UPI003F61C3C4
MKRETRLFDELDRFAGGSEITHALGLSFGYDGDLANERLWKPLVEKYGLRHPLVIADGVVDAGTALGVHVLRARRPSGVFHSKLFLAVRDGAVFAAIGSANLTRGGLGANLELLTPLVFAPDAERSPPRAVLEEILAFVRRVAGNLHIAEDSIERVLDVVDQATLVLDDLPAPRRGLDLRFFHSYEVPIWEQLRDLHGDDPVQHLLVVSPFLEADKPEAEGADSLLRHALGEGLPWAPRAKTPRLSLCTDAIDPNKPMPLPRLALEELAAAVEIRAQALSAEPRRLHGKLVAIFGKKRTTVLWGSPNFTPSALLRAARDRGNAECALALSMAASSADTADVLEEFDLGDLFHVYRGPLPLALIPAPPPPLIFDVGEALYDPKTRVLVVCGEAWSPSVDRIRVLAVEQQGSQVLFEGALLGAGKYAFEIQGPLLEEEDPETGRRRLRTLALRIEALDSGGAVLDAREVRPNVRFEDALALRENLLIETEAITADALLMPTATPEQRATAIDAQIEAWKAARQGEQKGPTLHQASLDTFFRNVRLGLDKQENGLVGRRCSRFALRRWSGDLRRSLTSACAGSIDGLRCAYLVARVAEHVARVLDMVPPCHEDPAPAYAAMEAEKLAAALESISLEGGVQQELLDEVRVARDSAAALLRRIAAGEQVAPPKGNDAERPKRRARRST